VALGRRITPVVAWIAGVELGIFLMFLFGAPEGLRLHLVMVPFLFIHEHQLWMPVTALLCHVEALSLIFNLLALWLFVPALEEIWGSRRFAAFFLGLGVLGYVVYGVLGYYLSPTVAVGGISSSILATVIAFGALYPRAPVSFFGLLPLTAKQLSWGIAIFALGTEALQQAWAVAAADAITMVAALLLTSETVRNRLSIARIRERRLRRRYKVLPGGRVDKSWLN
jgi:membrane associated rhomboid family serine protease